MDVEVRNIDTSKGKGLFARKAFANGSIIFEEEPLVSSQFSWNKTYQYKACDHCLRPLETAQENARRLTGKPDLELMYNDCCTTDKSKIHTCPQCGTDYCSLECQQTAFEQYHKTLCLHQTGDGNGGMHPLDQLDEAWRHIHYPPETNSIMLLVRLLARIIQSPNRDLAIEQTLQFCHRTVNEDAELAHKLLGPKFANQLSTLHALLLKAIPTHEADGIGQFLTVAGFQGLLALIGTNGQGVGTSAISQWVTNATDIAAGNNDTEALDRFIDKLYEDMDAHSGNFLNNEGVALFRLQSAANHSCTPNAEATYLHNNNRLSLVAIKDIQADEEICISYLDECNLERSRHSRRKELMENYLFACNCPRCELEQVDDPDVTSDEDEEEVEEDKDITDS